MIPVRGAFQRLATGASTLTFGVLEYPLDQNRIFGDSLSDQQDALWNTEPPHDAAAHSLLQKDKDTQRSYQNRITCR